MNRALSFGRWVRDCIVLALGILIATHVVDGISYDTSSTLLLVVVVLSLLNSIVRPLLITVFTIASLPFVIATLGIGVLLILWIINSLMFYATSKLINGFHVEAFSDAMWGALWVSLTATILNSLLGEKIAANGANKTYNPRQQARRIEKDDDVIDV